MTLHVLDAVLRHIQTLQEAVSIAPRNVEVVIVLSDAQNYPVYDLTVKDEHEYFANGILVSNCHALLYALVGMQRYGGEQAQVVGESALAGIPSGRVASVGPEETIVATIPRGSFSGENRVF